VKVIGAFLRKGVLAVEPTLGATALTLPLVSDSPPGSDNVVIPNSQIFFKSRRRGRHDRKHHGNGHHHGHHDKDHHHGKAHHDDEGPPDLCIGDLL